MEAIDALGGFAIFVYIFLLIVAILWFFLPFAIFGLKSRLDALIASSNKTNAYLKAIRKDLKSLQEDEEDSSSQI